MDSYKMTPMDQMSTEGPSYSLPAKVCVFVCACVCVCVCVYVCMCACASVRASNPTSLAYIKYDRMGQNYELTCTHARSRSNTPAN